MSASHSRTRALAAGLLLGLIGLVAVACAPKPPPYKGIVFNPPSIGYVGKHYTPTATSTSGLPVSLALDPSSTGCSFVNGVLNYDTVGSCVVNADQPGDATHAPDPQVQRTIKVYNCPPSALRNLDRTVESLGECGRHGSSFTGTVDLSSRGFGVQVFAGTVSCDIASMTFNSTPLTGVLSFDGSTLSSNYMGISIVLHAPAA